MKKIICVLIFLIMVIACNDKNENTETEASQFLPSNACADSTTKALISRLSKDTLEFSKSAFLKDLKIPNQLVDAPKNPHSSPISLKEAKQRIILFYAYLLKIICEDRLSEVTKLIKGNYSFDYARFYKPIESIRKRTNLKIDDIAVRTYPAIAQDSVTKEYYMTLVFTLEDMKRGETILSEYPVYNNDGRPTRIIKEDEKKIQETVSDQICPSCPETKNSIFPTSLIDDLNTLVEKSIDKKTKK